MSSPRSAVRVGDQVDRFRIVGKKGRHPNQLHDGRQQLVVVSRAVITGRRLLAAGEPTGALHGSQAERPDSPHGLNPEAMTIVQVTHNEDSAAEAKRIACLRDGRIGPD